MVTVQTRAADGSPPAKPTRMKKFLWIFGVLQLLMLALVAWLLFTTSGLRFALSFRPAELQLSAVQGTLWDGFALESVRYSQDGLDVSADRIAVALVWPELLKKTVRLQMLDVRKLSIMQSPLRQAVPTPESTAPSAWVLVIDQLLANELSFSQKAKPILRA